MSEAARGDAAAIENSNPEIQKPEAQLEISEQQTVQMEDHQGVGKTNPDGSTDTACSSTSATSSVTKEKVEKNDASQNESSMRRRRKREKSKDTVSATPTKDEPQTPTKDESQTPTKDEPQTPTKDESQTPTKSAARRRRQRSKDSVSATPTKDEPQTPTTRDESQTPTKSAARRRRQRSKDSVSATPTKDEPQTPTTKDESQTPTKSAARRRRPRRSRGKNKTPQTGKAATIAEESISDQDAPNAAKETTPAAKKKKADTAKHAPTASVKARAPDTDTDRATEVSNTATPKVLKKHNTAAPKVLKKQPSDIQRSATAPAGPRRQHGLFVSKTSRVMPADLQTPEQSGKSRKISDRNRAPQQVRMTRNQRSATFVARKLTHEMSQHHASKIKNRKCVLHPSAAFKTYWDMWVMVLIFYSVLSVPYRIAFDVPAVPGEVDWWFEQLVDLSFCIDVGMNFFTAYYNDRLDIVWDRKKIALNYLKWWFWVDLFSSVPIDTIINLVTGPKPADSRAITVSRSTKMLRILRLTKLLKFVRLLKLDKFMDLLRDHLPINIKWLKIFKLFFMQGFCAHMIGCIWFGLSEYVDDTSATWPHQNNLQDSPPFQQWVASIYWSYATMTTVGYGDIIAYNNVERVFAMGAMVVGVTVFGYTICKVAVSMSSGEPHESFKEFKIKYVRNFMRNHPIPQWTKDRVIEHFEYLFSRSENVLQERKAEMFSFLFPRLRNELFILLHKQALKRISFLKMLWVSSELQGDIVRALRYCFFHKGETIYHTGELGTQLYLIFQGAVEQECDPRSLARSRLLSSATTPASSTRNHRVMRDESIEPFVLKVNRDESHFGIVAPVLGCPRVSTAHAAMYTEGGFLLREDVDRLMREYPKFSTELTEQAEQMNRKCEQFAVDYIKTNASSLNLSASITAINEKNEEDSEDPEDPEDPQYGPEKTASKVATQELKVSTHDDGKDRKKKRKVKKALEVKAQLSGLLGTIVTPGSSKIAPGGVEADSATAVVVPRMSSTHALKKIVMMRSRLNKTKSIKNLVHGVGGETDYDSVIKKQYKHNKGKLATHLWQEHKLIHPNHPIKVVWDLFIGLLVIYVVMAVPYRLGYAIQVSAVIKAFDIFVDVMLLCDIVLNFRTTFMREDGEMEENPKPVMLAYCRGWFGIDMFSTMPFDHFAWLFFQIQDMSGGEQLDDKVTQTGLQVFKLLRIVKLFKMIRVLKLRRLCGNASRKLDIKDEYVDFVKCLFVFILFAHLYSCLWFGAAFNEEWTAETSGQSWVTNYCVFRSGTCLSSLNLGDATEQQDVTYYISSMYWVFATFTTVGYGDVHAIPYSNTEVLFSVIGMAVGSIVFARLITSVLNIVTSANDGFSEEREELLSDFMRKRNLSMPVQRVVRDAFRLYASKNNSEFDLGLIYTNMPNFLANTLSKCRESEFLQHNLLHRMEREFPGFISQLFGLGHLAHLPMDTVVVDAGETLNKIYFVLHGTLSVFDEQGFSLTELESGTWVGQQCLATPPKLPFEFKVQIRASKPTALYILEHADLYEMYQQCPALADRFFQQLKVYQHAKDWINVSDEHVDRLKITQADHDRLEREAPLFRSRKLSLGAFLEHLRVFHCPFMNGTDFTKGFSNGPFSKSKSAGIPASHNRQQLSDDSSI